MRFDLSDEEWLILEPLMPTARRSRRVDDRRIMNAIFFVLRTAIPRRDLPERCGPYTTAYDRFNRWSARGIWGRKFSALAARSRDSLQMIESTTRPAAPRHTLRQTRPQLPRRDLHGRRPLLGYAMSPDPRP